MLARLFSRHGVHLLSVGIPAVMLIAGLTWDSLRKRRSAARRRTALPPGAFVWLAGLAGVGAAAVHVAVVPEHAREWIGYAVFFFVAAVAQTGGAVLLVARRSRIVCAAVALGNAAIIGLWLVTRLVGVPIGPGTGSVEPVGRLDLVATSFEVVTVVAAVACLLRGSRRVWALPRWDASPERVGGRG